MAFHNVNYQMIPLTAGTYSTGFLGNGLTASTVHEIYCVSAGTISVTALGGGSATLGMVANESIKVLVAGCTVTSGTFLAFKTKFDASGFSNIQWGSNL